MKIWRLADLSLNNSYKMMDKMMNLLRNRFFFLPVSIGVAIIFLLALWIVPSELFAEDVHEGHADSSHTAVHDHGSGEQEHESNGTHAHTEDTEHTHDHDHGGFSGFMRWLGHWHPTVVHFPIGLLFGAAIAEIAFMISGRNWFRDAVRFCLWAGAFGALLAVPLGWLVAGWDLREDDWILGIHRWLGTWVLIWAFIQLRLFEKAFRTGRPQTWKQYRLLLFFGALTVVITGHFGGMLVFGPEHFRL